MWPVNHGRLVQRLRKSLGRAVERAQARDVAIYMTIALVVFGLVLFGMRLTGVVGSASRASHSAYQFDPPRKLPQNGQLVRSRVLRSGALEVEHWISSTEAIWEVSLKVPSGPPGVHGRVAAHRIDVDGSEGRGYGPRTVRRQAATYFVGATKTLYIRYRLIGALVPSASIEGRALAQLSALDVAFSPRGGPSTVVVLGARVLSVACARARPDAVFRPCGRPDGRAWRVDLDSRHVRNRVIAQLDLT